MNDGASDDLQFHSRHLEDSIVAGQIRIPHDPSVRLSFDWQIVAGLQEWTKSSSSQILNVVGPSQIGGMSSVASIASHCIYLALEAKIPVISFFCELPQRGTPLPDGTTPEMAALISLTYALIRQLIEHVQFAAMNSSSSLNRSKFERLDGCSNSIDAALEVLGFLLDQSPPILLCIVDGLQELDGKETRRHLTLLLETFRSQRNTRNVKLKDSDHPIKVLFTTAGRSRCLLDGLSTSEFIFAEHSNISRRIPGKSTPGRRSLSPRLLDPIYKEEFGVD